MFNINPSIMHANKLLNRCILLNGNQELIKPFADSHRVAKDISACKLAHEHTNRSTSTLLYSRQRKKVHSNLILLNKNKFLKLEYNDKITEQMKKQC